MDHEKNFHINDENAADFIEQIGGWIQEFIKAAHRKGVILGMSGGIDCCVVARLCQEAGVNTRLVIMPDGDNMLNSGSMKDARYFIDKFGFDSGEVNIKAACEATEASLNRPLGDLARSNIRPRERMKVLYTIAQEEHCAVIGTGNYCELLLGYFTKFGDGSYDLNPLGFCVKGEVRTLAKHLGVPEQIIRKPPSADLAAGQTDESDLGFDYEAMDRYILNGTSGDPETDKKIEARINMSKHKLMQPALFNASQVKKKRDTLDL